MEDGEVIFTMTDPPTIRSNPTQRAHSISLPMRIQTSSKKQTALNLNVYRNLHHRSHHALKKKFEKLATDLLGDIPPMGRIRLHYSVCPQTRRRLDIMNVCSVIDKYFSDALTENGIIEDDDYTHLDFVSCGFGGLAPKEHVLVTITEIEERDPMKLAMTAELGAEDIKEAIANYVSTKVDQEVSPSDVVMNNANSATVTVGDAPAATTTPAPKRKRRTKEEIAADKAAEKAANEPDADETVESGSDGDGTGSGNDTETTTQPTETTEADPAPAEDKQPKNDSAESTAESSKTDGPAEVVEEPAEAPVKKKRKSSIFDQ